MSKKFTVIDTQNEKIDKFKEDYDRLLLWSNYYVNTVKTTFENNKDKDLSDYPQEDLIKIAFAGVKFVNQFRNIKRAAKRLDMDIEKCLSTPDEAFRSIDALFNICGCLTLRNFVRTFPIRKKYDG